MSEKKQEQNTKKFWHSKTLWINLLAVAAIVVQGFTGYVISPENQVIILTIINTILRFTTKAKLDWKASDNAEKIEK